MIVQNPKTAPLFCVLHPVFQPPSQLFQPFSPLPGHIFNTIVNRSHHHIGRTGALINSQIKFQSFPIRDPLFQMQNRRLCQRRQRFVNALNHKIRAALQSRTWKQPACLSVFPLSLIKCKMSSMGLVHNQGNTPFMYNFCKAFYIGHNSLIGGRCQKNGPYPVFLIRLQNPSQFSRFNSSLDSGFLYDFRINVLCFHPVQHSRVIR